MTSSGEIRLSISLAKKDTELPENVGVTVSKDGILYPGRVIQSDNIAGESVVWWLSFETQPCFQLGDEVGLFAGSNELGSGTVISSG